MRAAPALVLFDIDGTLIRNAGPHHKDALVEGIRRVTGLQTTLDGVSTFGMLDGDLIAGMLRSSEKLSEDQIAANMERIMQAAEAAYIENCPGTLTDKLCPGVLTTLQNLEGAGAVLGVVTGNLQAIGWQKLELAGVRPFFRFGAFAQHGRTRAALAQTAREEALAQGLVQPNHPVTLIGDHSNDIGAAKQNSFRAVAVATGFLTVEQLSDFHPDLVIPDLTHLTPSNAF